MLALDRHHENIANCRKDDLNKLANHFISHYDRIAIEDLQITGMVQNHLSRKSILDAGRGYLKQRLIDKAAEAGRLVVLENPAYTSKACCSCGTVFTDLSRADRWLVCACGLSMDRVVNAGIKY